MKSFNRQCSCLLALLGLAFVIGCDHSSALNESTANVKPVTQAEFDSQVTSAAGPVVVDFYATWCGPCRLLAPMMEAQAGLFANQIKFLKVNVDEAPKLSQTFQIEAIPTVLFFKEGKLVDRITGLPSEAGLKAKLETFAAGK